MASLISIGRWLVPIALASTSAAHLLPHAGSAPSPFQPTHAARAHPAGGAAPGARQLQSPRGVQTSRSLQTAEVPRGGDEEDEDPTAATPPAPVSNAADDQPADGSMGSKFFGFLQNRMNTIR